MSRHVKVAPRYLRPEVFYAGETCCSVLMGQRQLTNQQKLRHFVERLIRECDWEQRFADLLQGCKAKAEADLVEAKEDKEAVMLELEQLANYKAELHSSCDFVMKNFEIRQTARDEEIEALKQAKAILSGAKFEAFLQSA